MINKFLVGSKPLSLWNMFICKISGDNTVNNGMPQIPQGYTYIQKLSTKSKYNVSLYVDKKTQKKVVIKSWVGKKKNLHYLSLLNEILIYKNLSNETFKNFSVPKLIGSKIENNLLLLITEYIDTNIKSEISIEEKIKIYFDITNELHNANIKKTHLPNRGRLSYFFTINPITIFAIINFPQYKILLLKAYLKFWQNAKQLNKVRFNYVVHKDLNFENIIFSKDTAYLIDLQYLTISTRIIDYVATLRFYVNNSSFMKLFKKRLRHILTSEEQKALDALACYYSILGLTDKRVSLSRINDFASILMEVTNESR